MAKTFKLMQGPLFPSAYTLIPEEMLQSPNDEDTDSHPEAKFIDEIRCLDFIQTVMRKPKWQYKLQDPQIIARWKKEAKKEGIRKEVFNYAIQELAYHAEKKDMTTGVESSGVDMVWISDNLLSEDLKTRFEEKVSSFEKSLLEKDYHPGSNEQVVNLIHPSLFCLVYGKTQDFKGNVIQYKLEAPEPNAEHSNELMKMQSNKYQWLPAEFMLDNEGKVKIASYINNLPFESGLYPLIAEVFEAVVPLFNRVLSDLRNHRQRLRFESPLHYDWWYPSSPPSEVYEGIDEDNDAALDAKYDEWFESQPPLPLPIPAFEKSLFDIAPKYAIDLKGHQLQVITKIGSIELTPENPTFRAGKWHVEGMINERIVATAIYYYDSENIAGDQLKFRQGVHLFKENFEQNDIRGPILLYGIDREDPMVQPAGAIHTPAGRVIAFPNVYQQAVGEFSLQDKTKPGHRKILVFFLVDPTSRIVSTEQVPPQNIAWQDNDLLKTLGTILPVEISDMIISHVGYRMTLEEAKEHRLKLMEERSVARDTVTDIIYERPFNLCEH